MIDYSRADASGKNEGDGVDSPGTERDRTARDRTAEQDSQQEAQTVYRHAGVVTFYTLLSRILGMIRDVTLAHRFGASGATDAWVQAFRLPNALRRLTAEGAMTIAFVPLYTKVLHQEGEATAKVLARETLGVVLLVTGVLSLAGIVFSESITAISSPGFLSNPQKFALSARLLRWSFPYLAMVSFVAWAMGVLNARSRFAAPAAAPIFLNLSIIVAVLAPQGWISPPVMAVAVGVLAGGVAQVLLQCPWLLQEGIPLRPSFQMGRHVRKLLALLAPALLGLAVYQINILLLGILASFLPTGQVFHYHNATRLTELVLGLFTFAFAAAGLPALSIHIAQKNWHRIRQTLSLTLEASFYPLLPSIAAFMAASQAIVAMLYLHGEFSFADVRSTASTLRWMALGVPAIAGIRIMTPAFYAYGDTRRPVLAAAVNMLITIPSGWLLSQRFLAPGLAGALSLGVWMQCLLLWSMLNKKTADHGTWTPWRALLRQTLAALLIGLLIGKLQSYGQWQLGPQHLQNWWLFTLCLITGGGGYWVLTFLLGDQQARHWLQLFKKIFQGLGLR